MYAPWDPKQVKQPTRLLRILELSPLAPALSEQRLGIRIC